MVQLHGIHQLGALVHCDELLCAFGDVQLLCPEGGTLQSATLHLDDHHIPAVDPNDHRLCDQCVGQWVPEDTWHTIVQHIAAQHKSIDCHVLQLFCALCAFLLQGLPVAGWTQESSHGCLTGGTEYRQIARIGGEGTATFHWGCTGCISAQQGQGAVMDVVARCHDPSNNNLLLLLRLRLLIPLWLRTFNLCSMRCKSCFLILNKRNAAHTHTHTKRTTTPIPTHTYTRVRTCEGRLRNFNYKHRVLPRRLASPQHPHNKHIPRELIYIDVYIRVMYILYNMNVISPPGRVKKRRS